MMKKFVHPMCKCMICCLNPSKYYMEVGCYGITEQSHPCLFPDGWAYVCEMCKEKLEKQLEPKPLAQYLAEYLATGIDRLHEKGMPMDFNEEGLKPIFEQALEAYQSTENVTIKIERMTE